MAPVHRVSCAIVKMPCALFVFVCELASSWQPARFLFSRMMYVNAASFYDKQVVMVYLTPEV